MLNIEMTRTGSTFIVRLVGHAQAADIGHDVVCAAASILCYTAAQTALDLYGAGKLRKKPRVEVAQGDSTITLCPRRDAVAEAMTALHTIETGFALLAHHYPEYVSFTPFAAGKTPV